MTARAPRYLGLDISTRTGYALVEGDKLIKSGVRDFSVKSTEHIGKRGIKFYNFLLSLGQVDEIYYEKIQFGKGFKTPDGKWVNPTNDGRELYHGLLMLMNMYAAGFGIFTFGVHPSTLKKAFTGNGHADKKEMCQRARELGWQGGQDDSALFHDEVDGIALVETQLREKYNIKLVF
jgi:hypothetical protein